MTPALTPAKSGHNHLRPPPMKRWSHGEKWHYFFGKTTYHSTKPPQTDHLFLSFGKARKSLNRPALRGGVTWIGGACDPYPLSCTFFEHPVHLPVFGSTENIGCHTPGHTTLTRLRLRRETTCYLLFTRRAVTAAHKPLRWVAFGSAFATY